MNASSAPDGDSLCRAVAKYLGSRAVMRPVHSRQAWSLETRVAIAIPAFAESAHLFATLASLGNLPAQDLARLTVLVVVNNPPPAAPPKGMEPARFAAAGADNKETLRGLPDAAASLPVRIMWVDAASPGLELPAGTGVGMARKIAADTLLHCFAQAGGTAVAQAVIMHLDADSLVGPDYLRAADILLASGKPAGALAFRHQESDKAEITAAINEYELGLHYLVQGLRLAGSPYAFHSVGSTMLSTAAAYARAGGMPGSRLAGEDFYFLQQMQKIGGVLRIGNVTVNPSPRVSDRVLFGTGASMRAAVEQRGKQLRPAYDPRVFLSLRELLAAAARAAGSGELPAVSLPAAAAFLHRAGLERVWPGFVRQHRTPAALLKAFHDWFDGLATIRFCRYLASVLWPEMPVAEAWRGLLPELGAAVDVDVENRETLLEWCRKREWPA